MGSKTRRSARLHAAFLVLFAIVSTDDGLAGKKKKAKNVEPTLSLQWAPTDDKQESAIWLSYLIARTNYVAEHESEYDLQPGPLMARFEEEVQARQTAARIYSELLEQGDQRPLPYFDDLSLIDGAGLMKEYVWTYFRQESWGEAPATLRLDQFSDWRLEHMPEHQPETQGGLSVELSE
jgi:hypothetical protein